MCDSNILSRLNIYFLNRQDGQSVDDICEDAAYELSNTFEHDIERYNELLQKFLKIFHPNHYISKKVFLIYRYSTAISIGHDYKKTFYLYC